MSFRISANRSLLTIAVCVCLANNHFAAVKSAADVPETPAQDVQWEIKPRAADNFTKAIFRIWIPENTKQLRGLLVLLPGWNSDGRPLADKETWRTFARENQFALVACFLRSQKISLENPRWMYRCYWMAELGSGKALIDALKKFSGLTGRPEIENLPVLIRGYSAGGQFSYSFACYAPERIIGFVSVKGVYYFSKASAQTSEVPAIFILGENDHYRQIPRVMRLFKKYRAQGAPWAVAIEPDAGHEAGNSDDLVLPFLNALVKKRLEDGKNHYKDIKPIEPSESWLCDLKTHRIFPYKEGLRDIKEAAWLPDKNVAEVWQCFVTVENQNSQKKKVKSHKAGK
jgi:dienelactone hydrolase